MTGGGEEQWAGLAGQGMEINDHELEDWMISRSAFQPLPFCEIQGRRTSRVCLRAEECQEGSIRGKALALFLGNLWEWVPAWSTWDQCCLGNARLHLVSPS